MIGRVDRVAAVTCCVEFTSSLAHVEDTVGIRVFCTVCEIALVKSTIVITVVAEEFTLVERSVVVAVIAVKLIAVRNAIAIAVIGITRR